MLGYRKKTHILSHPLSTSKKGGKLCYSDHFYLSSFFENSKPSLTTKIAIYTEHAYPLSDVSLAWKPSYVSMSVTHPKLFRVYLKSLRRFMDL